MNISNINIKIDKEKENTLYKEGKLRTCVVKTIGEQGTGFFCKIPFLNKTKKVLLTCNHILNNNSIKIGNIIKLIYKNKEKKIQFTEERFCKTNVVLDYTCIEILDNDGIEDFFQIQNDENIKESIKQYINDDISILHYPNRNRLTVNTGYIMKKDNDDYHIIYNIITEQGSSGAPLILLYNEFKLLGMHIGKYGKYGDKILKKGIFINKILEDINQNYILGDYTIFDTFNGIKILDERVNKKNFFQYLFKGNDNILDIYKDKEKINVKQGFIKLDNEKDKKKNNILIKFKKEMHDLNHLFYDCSYLTSLQLSEFYTNNVENMSYMFYNCSSLSSLDLSNFNTNKVKDMSYMFSNCILLSSLDLSNFNTNNVKDMNNMFSECSSLTSLDLSNFNNSNVKNMSNMFYNCCSLISLDLSTFNTNKVKDMSYMFSNCQSLKSLILSNFNTLNTLNMSWMFNKCSSLTSLNLSNFNTNNVNNMNGMFSGCTSLTSLNLSNFNTNNVTEMSFMFAHCFSLKILNLLNFNLKKVKYKDNIFFNCIIKRIITKDEEILNKY